MNKKSFIKCKYFLYIECIVYCLLNISQRVNGDICYYFPENSNKNSSYFTECEICCAGKPKSSQDTCCDTKASDVIWAIPLFIFTSCCFITVICFSAYVAYSRYNVRMKLFKRLSQMNRRNLDDESPEINVSVIEINELTSERNRESKLPSYNEAFKMDKEYLPKYKDIFEN